MNRRERRAAKVEAARQERERSRAAREAVMEEVKGERMVANELSVYIHGRPRHFSCICQKVHVLEGPNQTTDPVFGDELHCQCGRRWRMIDPLDQ